MTDKDIKRLTDLARKIARQKRTKEEALAILVSAGIMTKKGNYTKHYPHLARLFNK